MQHRVFFAPAVLVWALLPGACFSADGDSSEPAGVTALKQGVLVNLDYCQQWLDGGDFKSLRQTAAGVQLLAAVLASKSDQQDWQQASEHLQAHVKQLSQAAADKQADRCGKLLAESRRAVEQFPRLPGKPAAGGKKPTANLNSMMKLLEGTLADTKAAVTFGEIENAKTGARVLIELAPVLSNMRKGEAWQKHAAALAAAARPVAEVQTDKPTELRALIRGIGQSCEACHNRNK